MLQIALPLAATNAAQLAANSELAPMAGLTMEVKGGERRVNITLKGVICGASADTLLQFLQGASAFTGNKWCLQMKDLLVLSGRGIKTLISFAKHLGWRGFKVEVLGINQNLFAAMNELKLAQAFAWPD